MSQPYSYLIGIRDNVVYAKNGKTSDIDFCGTDARKVIQSAIDALANGGKIFFKAGTYTLSTYLAINQDDIILQGEGQLATSLISTTSDIIRLQQPSATANLYRIVIKDLSIGKFSDLTGGHGISSADIASGYSVDRLIIDNVRFAYIVGANKYALYLKNPERVTVRDCFFYKTNASLCRIENEEYDAGNMLFIGNSWNIVNSGKIAVDIEAPSGQTGDIRRIVFIKDNFLAPSAGGTGVKVRATGGEVTHIYFENVAFEKFDTAIDIDGSATRIAGKGEIKGSNFNQFAINNSKLIKLGQYSRAMNVLDNDFWGSLAYTISGIEDLNTNTELPNTIFRNKFHSISNPIIPSSASKVRFNIGYVTENSGVATFSGDGTTKVFSISSHGLALTPTNRTKVKAYGTPQSTDAENASPLSVYPADLDGDGNYEGLKIVFAEAPIAGTDNVKVTWYAEL